MARLFGTDGVRGVANTQLTCDLAFKLGQAAVAFQGKTILIGKDTRLSGDMLESAVAAGIMSMGGTALLAGIIPTPAIALLVRELHCDGGIVISASHNPPEYNGIKLFDAQGFKLPDAVEDEIEAFVARGGAAADELPAGDAVGVALPVDDACELYIAHAVATVADEGIDLSGLKVALDVGHGASCMTSAEALRRLGADVTVVNEDFDGTDINVQCGSTHLGPVCDLVAEIGADVGIAHDGDADRVMLVDAHGNEIDGDVVEAVCAIDLKERGLLAGNTAVSTVMCNLGLAHALRDAGIELVQTKVGDRYVLEAMREGGFVLGGEQSGHMIFLEHNSTGDGLVTALQFLAACKRAGKSIADAAAVMTRFPQTLVNVHVKDKHAVDGNAAVAAAVEAAEAELGDSGRVLLRPSGTEPVVRVMVEAASAEEADRHAHAIAAVVEREV
ncbi:MAG: phosphoglucosamine mutase [Gordonibacter pamelaeae]|uniref:Phosphoglucosamine mutase n=2 Tax=Gordonibacter pamelaeae TaxID=471189 RepID=A0A369LWY2_9ACTN|nr:phosphoglucosamine mutase [Gordonibacter pamelaeae]HJH72765.1 phosphoglucosamine mutase [Eggerthellaceae bacterium]MBS4895839.1 phosphoglucosamine mutase [Gordonibacter pamelaeae]MCB6312810.1 phosphoglucosamine mutase [Gordonibacter pamelaeae]MCQ4847527.1 phosphoglucosamine mutase [Gordonibacter pamelaeae]MCQ4850161.1 phosphoglucosamine mutase [Gordonibacter pamelaeae]